MYSVLYWDTKWGDPSEFKGFINNGQRGVSMYIIIIISITI